MSFLWDRGSRLIVFEYEVGNSSLKSTIITMSQSKLNLYPRIQFHLNTSLSCKTDKTSRIRTIESMFSHTLCAMEGDSTLTTFLRQK